MVLRHLEAQLLERALTARPYALIVLGDGVLIDAANLRRVRGTAALVYFRLPLASAYWELRRQLREQPPGPSPFVPQFLEHCAQLKPLWKERLPGFAGAHLTLDMEGRRPEDVVPLLLEALPGLASAAASGSENR
jgi:shikimate kinase